MKRYFRMWACRWNPIFFLIQCNQDPFLAISLGGEYEAEVREGIYRCIAGTRVASVAADGSIYYYVGPTERTKIHQIDCNEYWNYVRGSTLEICLIQEDGTLTIRKLGVEAGAEPLIYVPKGTIFASKHAGPTTEGTFITCITVPRFTYDGFTLISDEDMLAKYPQAATFLD